jgi:hypothetical protein
LKPEEQPPQRKYPPVIERLVPIALGLILLAIVVLIIIIFGVAFGWMA